MDSWIGASRGGLIRNMGVPDKSVVDGDTEYFVYKRFDQRYIAPTPTTYIPVDYGYGNKFTSVIPGTPGGMRTDWCDMTFTIRGDRVTAWSAKGNDCRD
ncbi:MAG: hypothetical protein HY795_05835 [Desulfovibrio sp.]|nr:hypothetical protein [Desulfovibrio sp.]MBI4961353.1 hypothetical protein [Desulfovibrio sp.]